VLIELDPVDRITADAVGEPGERVFYLQARKGTDLVTFLLEKEQVQLLAASVVDILARIDKEVGEGPPEDQMGLEEPIVPEWRVARLSIGYQEERDLFVLELTEQLPGEEGTYGDQGEEGAAPPSGLEAIGPELVVEIEDPRERSGMPESSEEEDLDAGESEEPLSDDDADALARALDAVSERGEILGDDVREANQVRLWATREQMLSLARHGAAVSARGRPRCQFCNQPMDPEGHVCAAMNGHGTLDT